MALHPMEKQTADLHVCTKVILFNSHLFFSFPSSALFCKWVYFPKLESIGFSQLVSCAVAAAFCRATWTTCWSQVFTQATVKYKCCRSGPVCLADQVSHACFSTNLPVIQVPCKGQRKRIWQQRATTVTSKPWELRSSSPCQYLCRNWLDGVLSWGTGTPRETSHTDKLLLPAEQSYREKRKVPQRQTCWQVADLAFEASVPAPSWSRKSSWAQDLCYQHAVENLAPGVPGKEDVR